jgi:hypothetical protein
VGFLHFVPVKWLSENLVVWKSVFSAFGSIRTVVILVPGKMVCLPLVLANGCTIDAGKIVFLHLVLVKMVIGQCSWKNGFAVWLLPKISTRTVVAGQTGLLATVLVKMFFPCIVTQNIACSLCCGCGTCRIRNLYRIRTRGPHHDPNI